MKVVQIYQYNQSSESLKLPIMTFLACLNLPKFDFTWMGDRFSGDQKLNFNLNYRVIFLFLVLWTHTLSILKEFGFFSKMLSYTYVLSLNSVWKFTKFHVISRKFTKISRKMLHWIILSKGGNFQSWNLLLVFSFVLCRIKQKKKSFSREKKSQKISRNFT